MYFWKFKTPKHGYKLLHKKNPAGIFRFSYVTACWHVFMHQLWSKKRKWRLKTESYNSFLIRVLFVQLQQFNPYQISYYHEMKKEKDSKSLYAMSMAKTLSLHIMLVEMRKNMQSHKITSFLSHLLMDRWTSKTHY